MAALKRILGIWRLVSFRLWALKLEVMLRARGGRLELDAPHGAKLDGWPRLKIHRQALGPGTFVLRIAPGVSLGYGLVFEIWAGGGNSTLELGRNALIHDGVRFQLRHGTVRLGEHVQLRENVLLKSEGELVMRDHSAIGNGGMIHCNESVVFDVNASMAERCSVIDSDHTFERDGGYLLESPIVSAPIFIGAYVFAGANCVFLRGARIGPDSVVGAGAVVRGGEYPSGWLIGGVPAKPLKAISSDPAPAA